MAWFLSIISQGLAQGTARHQVHTDATGEQ